MDGRRVNAFDKAWGAACQRAVLTNRIFHDLRRTATRRLEDTGVPRSVAMKITGHRTESMYLRYAGIRDKRDLKEAARRVEAHRVELANVPKTFTKTVTDQKSEIQ